MSEQSEKVLAEAIATKEKVDSMAVVLVAVREELKQIKDQTDPHLAEAVAILDAAQGRADEVLTEGPGFEPSQN